VKKTAPPADWSADNNAADNDDLVTGFHGAKHEGNGGEKSSGNSWDARLEAIGSCPVQPGVAIGRIAGG
jgi:hypothetical protein